jgi:hypothetical protein
MEQKNKNHQRRQQPSALAHRTKQEFDDAPYFDTVHWEDNLTQRPGPGFDFLKGASARRFLSKQTFLSCQPACDLPDVKQKARLRPKAG